MSKRETKKRNKGGDLPPAELAARRRIVKQVVEHLEAVYGIPHPNDEDGEDDPLDELIGTILSQSTTDHNSRRAFASLKSRFPDWESARRARATSIAAAIKSGGLAQVKSVVIKNILNEIKVRTGGLDLGFLQAAPLDEAQTFLTSLKGVGPKTASCVLLFACRQPVFPMDTHIFRITRRLGLIPERGSDDEAHRLMLKLVPARKHYSLHINLIRHGRRICRPRDPDCERCALLEFCPTGQGLKPVLNDELVFG
jgi:endonuclease-3